MLTERFQFIRQIAESHSGKVYEVRDRSKEGKTFALKVFTHYAILPDSFEHFKKGFETYKKIDHPNLIKVYEAIEVDGWPAFTMELLPGLSLAKTFHDPQLLSVDRIKDTICQTLAALLKLYQEGVCHAYITADDIMLSEDGTVKVIDFGFKNTLRFSPYHFPFEHCTDLALQYFPPEWQQGKYAPDERSYVYMCGAILHELVTGKRLIPDGSLSTNLQFLKHRFQKLPARVPKSYKKFEKILHLSYAKNPNERFQSISDMKDAIEGVSLNSAYIRQSRINHVKNWFRVRPLFLHRVPSRIYELAAIIVLIVVTSFLAVPLIDAECSSPSCRARLFESLDSTPREIRG